MFDPLANAYAAPKVESTVALGGNGRDPRTALRLAAGFLWGTEAIKVGTWLVRVLPLLWVTTDGLLDGLLWQLLFHIANFLSGVFLLRGHRKIVWLPIAIAAYKELALLLNSAAPPIPVRATIVGFAIFALYIGILLVLVWRRSGRRLVAAAVVGIAAYLVLIVVQWFSVVTLILPRPGS